MILLKQNKLVKQIIDFYVFVLKTMILHFQNWKLQFGVHENF